VILYSSSLPSYKADTDSKGKKKKKGKTTHVEGGHNGFIQAMKGLRNG